MAQTKYRTVRLLGMLCAISQRLVWIAALRGTRSCTDKVHFAGSGTFGAVFESIEATEFHQQPESYNPCVMKKVSCTSIVRSQFAPNLHFL